MKIAIVNQRYGIEVNGGSEQHARMLAERLACVPGYNIEVLTTCALDYTTWKNHYPPGTGEINGVKIRRFKNKKTRKTSSFNRFSNKIFFSGMPVSLKTEQKWVERQGPCCPGLIEYIKAHRDDYDVFIFFTYLYYPTVYGVPEIKNKAILVPTAHDEPAIYLGIYKQVFENPGGIAYNTTEERDFLCNLFNIGHIPGDIFGVGVDIPGQTDIPGNADMPKQTDIPGNADMPGDISGAGDDTKTPDPGRFKEKYKIGEYLLYAGRIDKGKGVIELCEYFIKYKTENPSGMKLVIMGKEADKPPQHPDIVNLGFVPDEELKDAMAGARLFMMPSEHESLSMVVLESMALGVPVVVNRKCEVLKGHCLKSNAGLYYGDYAEFKGCLNYLLSGEHDNEYKQMKQNAVEYVKTNYNWDDIINRYKKMIDNIVS